MKPYIIISLLVLMVFVSGCLNIPCPDTSEPVCGEDGTTYKNACLAKQAGVEVKTTGACQQLPQCSDSDGGKDIFTSGTVTANGAVQSDSCVNESVVEEKSCMNNAATSERLPCPAGYACQGGKCNVVPCTDSDGGINEDTKGTVVSATGSENDECTDSNTVNEAYCDGGDIAYRQVDCETGKECRDGACVVAPCEDSDGGKDTSEAGRTSKGSISQADSCVSATSVKEYFCEGGDIDNEVMQCGSGYSCLSGECRQDRCNDSDGGKDTSQKGTTSYGNRSYTDSCYSNLAVLEYYCASDTVIDDERINCGSGKECFDGKCRNVECAENMTDVDDTDERYEIKGYDDSDELTLYTDNAVEINDKFILELYSVSGNDTTFKLYESYADYKDDDDLCSVTIEAGDHDGDFCGENTAEVSVLSANDSEDSAEVTIDEYYAVQYYSQEGTIVNWTDNPICPDDRESYDRHTSEFYPYLDTSSSGLDLDGKKFKLFSSLATIREVTDTSITFTVDGDEYEVESGDDFEYRGEDYEVALTFNDGGLFKFRVTPA